MRVGEVSARRITACPSLSALTMRGASAASGRSFWMRATASRMSDAAMSRFASSPNSTVTRLVPKDEDEEMDCTPDTRPAAPSMTVVTSRSMVSGLAPWNWVDTVTTGRSTWGSSRTSTPRRAARPAITIRALMTKARIGRRT